MCVCVCVCVCAGGVEVVVKAWLLWQCTTQRLRGMPIMAEIDGARVTYRGISAQSRRCVLPRVLRMFSTVCGEIRRRRRRRRHRRRNLHTRPDGAGAHQAT